MKRPKILRNDTFVGHTDLNYKSTYGHFLSCVISDKNRIKYKENIINAEVFYNVINSICLFTDKYIYRYIYVVF